MADAWGYRLPNFPNDRGTRAVYRDSVKRCVLLVSHIYCSVIDCSGLLFLASHPFSRFAVCRVIGIVRSVSVIVLLGTGAVKLDLFYGISPNKWG